MDSSTLWTAIAIMKAMPDNAASSAAAAAASAAEAQELVDAVDVATVEETFSFLNIRP